MDASREEAAQRPVYLYQGLRRPRSCGARLLEPFHSQQEGSWAVSPACCNRGALRADPELGLHWALAPDLAHATSFPGVLQPWNTVYFSLCRLLGIADPAERAGELQRWTAEHWKVVNCSFWLSYGMGVGGLCMPARLELEAQVVMWTGAVLMLPQAVSWVGCWNLDLLWLVVKQFESWYLLANGLGFTVLFAMIIPQERVPPMLLTIGTTHVLGHFGSDVVMLGDGNEKQTTHYTRVPHLLGCTVNTALWLLLSLGWFTARNPVIHVLEVGFNVESFCLSCLTNVWLFSIKFAFIKWRRPDCCASVTVQLSVALRADSEASLHRACAPKCACASQSELVLNQVHQPPSSVEPSDQADPSPRQVVFDCEQDDATRSALSSTLSIDKEVQPQVEPTKKSGNKSEDVKRAKPRRGSAELSPRVKEGQALRAERLDSLWHSCHEHDAIGYYDV